MNNHAIAQLVNAIVFPLLGCFVFFRGTNRLLARIYFLYSLATGFWSFSFFKMATAQSDITGLFWAKTLHLGAIFIPVFFLHFVYVFIGTTPTRKHRLVGVYIIAVLLMLSIPSNFFVSHTVSIFNFKYFVGPAGLQYHIFSLFFAACVLTALFELWLEKRHWSGIRRNQANYFLYAFSATYFFGCMAFLPLFKIPIPPFVLYSVSIHGLLIVYAIIKYHLMDIRIAIARGVLFVFVYAFVLGIPFFLITTGLAFLIRTFGVHWLTYYTFFSLLIASSGPIIYNLIRTKAENKLLAKQRAYQEYITTMAQGIVLYRDKHEVAQAIRDILIPNMEVERVLLFYLARRAKEFISLEGKGEEQIHISWVDHSTTILLERWKEPIMNEELMRSGVGKHIQVQDTEALLKQANAVMFVPCIAGEEVVGFISVGQKKDKSIFTMDDVRVLKLLASEAALALKNVEFYQEMRENEMRLIQTAKLTSLGEVAAGFAHQINNPLATISGTETVLYNDIHDYVEQIEQQGFTSGIKKSLLCSVDDKLERIKRNSTRIKIIVDSIRRFTKKTEYSQEEVKQLIQNGLDMIPESKLKLAHVRVVQHIPDNIPKVSVKAIDIEQVVMNLCTNAIEAMETQGEGTITIDVRESDEKGYVAIAISDTGCGIPDEIRERIFDPFFTTKGAQGTGLGLSVVHTIIKDNQGHITCTSKPNKGTTFTILLPITRKQTNEEER